MKRLAIGWVIALGLGACEGPPSAAPAAAASGAPAPHASASVRAASAKKALRKSADPSLAALALAEGGRYVAELGPERRRVEVVLSTKDHPLAPRPLAAYHAIAELVAPGLVPPTRLNAIALRDILNAAADDRTRRSLTRQLRVLADGNVQAALCDAPAPGLRSVEVGDLIEGQRVWQWESKLVVKELPPEAPRALLASYQKLLAVDYLVQNQRRREVLLDESAGRLIAQVDNDVFSERAREGAISDALGRLSGHLSYSASLADKLAKLDRAALERALPRAPDGSLLVTPKQVDDVLDHKRALDKLLEMRVKQRGRERALALP